MESYELERERQRDAAAQLEVVGLHHASVPAPDHPDLGGFLNEGIRIVAFVKEQPLPPAQRTLADELLTPERVETTATIPAGGADVTLTVPLQITVRLAA